MTQPSSPSLYPCQLRCHGCAMISNMPPSNASDNFFCPNCHLQQTKQTVLLCSSSNRVKVHGIDPYKMQVVCAHCLAILNIPPQGLAYSSARFRCPLCRLQLPCFIFPVNLSSTAELPDKALECMDDNCDMKNVTSSSVSTVEDEPPRSILLLKDKTRIREFEKVDDCFILDFDPCGVSSDSKCLDDRVEDDLNAVDLAKQEQAPCRSRPFQGNLCAKHRFNKTANDLHSKESSCYICDLLAPSSEHPKGDLSS